MELGENYILPELPRKLLNVHLIGLQIHESDFGLMVMSIAHLFESVNLTHRNVPMRLISISKQVKEARIAKRLVQQLLRGSYFTGVGVACNNKWNELRWSSYVYGKAFRGSRWTASSNIQLLR